LPSTPALISQEAGTPSAVCIASHCLRRWSLAVSAAAPYFWVPVPDPEIRLRNHWSSRRGVDKNQGEAAPRKAGREGIIRRPRRELEES